jgi:hypothetical protein
MCLLRAHRRSRPPLDKWTGVGVPRTSPRRREGQGGKVVQPATPLLATPHTAARRPAPARASRPPT